MRDPMAETLLNKGLEALPEAAPLHFSLGLLKVRSKNMADALIELRRAVVLDPQNAHYRYVLAVALDSADQRDAALALIAEGLDLTPANQTLLTLQQQLQNKDATQ